MGKVDFRDLWDGPQNFRCGDELINPELGYEREGYKARTDGKSQVWELERGWSDVCSSRENMKNHLRFTKLGCLIWGSYFLAK